MAIGWGKILLIVFHNGNYVIVYKIGMDTGQNSSNNYKCRIFSGNRIGTTTVFSSKHSFKFQQNNHTCRSMSLYIYETHYTNH